MLIVKSLGLQPYDTTLRLMQAWVERNSVAQEVSYQLDDELWCLQHPPVYTLGQAVNASQPDTLLNSEIPVVNSDRGGKITYHGPGQLVIYFLLNLRRLKLSSKSLVQLVEESLVEYLADLEISAYADAHRPGLYVDTHRGEGKIASLGFRIRKGYSYHGVALNVDMDMMPFECIHPCGYQGMKMIQLKDLLGDSFVSFEQVQTSLAAIFTQKLK